ncbi:hypothetical protein [Faecalispora anaeroviscerum]|uniref:hypothetical protein n=1 Tax=Faecalispora anaeroviscerum TaxID=2991836 RepID=UPI0024BA8AD8|nr:hypothetical protein [Faecalispora anaeroviscerum]
MAKIIFQDEEGQNLNRYLITPTDGSAPFTADLTREAVITKQGTPYSKEVGDRLVQDEDLENHTADTIAHMTQAQKDLLAAAVQLATIGGIDVTKSGTTLQFPAYPTTLPANGGTAANTTSVAGAFLWATSDPSSTIAAGKLYVVK